MTGAILPAAGRGTRMGALTGGRPKELLPLGTRTVLARVLEEALSIAEAVAVVTAPDKPEIGASLPPGILVALQEIPYGFAHAVRIGVDALPPCDEYVVLLPDTLLVPGCGQFDAVSAGMVAALRAGVDVVFATETVPESEVRRYGILETDSDERIIRVLEKPEPGTTASRLAVGGRYGFRASVAEELRRACDAHLAGGGHPELSLTTVLGDAITKHGFIGRVVSLDHALRLDCGSPEGYAEAAKLFS